MNTRRRIPHALTANGLIAVLMCIMPITAILGYWSPPYNVSQSKGNSGDPKIMVGKDKKIHFFWVDNSQYPFDYRLQYRAKTPNGTWSEISAIPDGKVQSWYDPVLDSEGNVHVLWDGDWFASKPLNGDWTQASHTQIAGDLQAGPSGTLHIMHSEGGYIERSSGGTWSPVIELPGNFQGCRYVVSSDSKPHAACNKSDDVFYIQLADDSQWGIPLNISNSQTKSGGGPIEIDKDNTVHIVWLDQTSPNGNDIFYVAVKNGIASTVENLSQTPNEQNSVPRLLASPDGNVHASWNDTGGAYYAHRNSNEVWSSPENVNTLPVVDMFVSDENDVHFIWHDYDDYMYLHSWRSPSGDWSNTTGVPVGAVPIDADTGDNHTLHVVWASFLDDAPNVAYVHYRTFDSYGYLPYMTNLSQ